MEGAAQERGGGESTNNAMNLGNSEDLWRRCKPLDAVVLSGADLQVVRSVYNMYPEALTIKLFYEAYICGVSNDSGVLDFLYDHLNLRDLYEEHYSIPEYTVCYPAIIRMFSFRLSLEEQRRASFVEPFLSNLIRAVQKIVRAAVLPKQRLTFNWRLVDDDDDDHDDDVCASESKDFFGIIESIFQNKSICDLIIDFPAKFPMDGTAETPKEIIESISALVGRGECRIKFLGIHLNAWTDYLELFLTKVAMKIPDLKLKLKLEIVTPEAAISMSKLLERGRLKKLEISFGWMSNGVPSDLLAPLATNSTAKTLILRGAKFSKEERAACEEVILGILKHTNTTLEHVELNNHECCQWNVLTLYLALNQLGRGRFRDPTVPMAMFVNDLISVQNKCNEPFSCRRLGMETVRDGDGDLVWVVKPIHSSPTVSLDIRLTNYLYVLLRESASKWTVICGSGNGNLECQLEPAKNNNPLEEAAGGAGAGAGAGASASKANMDNDKRGTKRKTPEL